MIVAKKGQIRKADIGKYLAAVDAFESNNAKRISKLRVKFRKWIKGELDCLRSRIRDQDYVFSVNSQSRFIGTSLARMESGEIVDITDGGTGFKLRGQA